MKRRTFINTLFLSSGALILDHQIARAIAAQKDTIKLYMVYNNMGEKEGYKSHWGLSIWIEENNDASLFDTGGNASILWDNLSNIDINTEKLSRIVISHDHNDHTNGLRSVLEKTNNKPEVYVVKDDFEKYKQDYPDAQIKTVKTFTEIKPNMWLTEQLVASLPMRTINEQSIILIQDDSLFLITGCSHSGIAEMVRKVKDKFPEKKIELVTGGFHLIGKSEEEIKEISDDLKRSGVVHLAPSHCTGDKAIDIFKKEWGDKFVSFNLGDEMTI